MLYKSYTTYTKVLQIIIHNLKGPISSKADYISYCITLLQLILQLCMWKKHAYRNSHTFPTNREQSQRNLHQLSVASACTVHYNEALRTHNVWTMGLRSSEFCGLELPLFSHSVKKNLLITIKSYFHKNARQMHLTKPLKPYEIKHSLSYISLQVPFSAHPLTILSLICKYFCFVT